MLTLQQTPHGYRPPPQATDNLNQRIHVIAPGRTNTEGLTLSATGTGGTVKRQIICSGGGELRPHDD
jgi:hypothetical protein